MEKRGKSSAKGIKSVSHLSVSWLVSSYLVCYIGSLKSFQIASIPALCPIKHQRLENKTTNNWIPPFSSKFDFKT